MTTLGECGDKMGMKTGNDFSGGELSNNLEVGNTSDKTSDNYIQGMTVERMSTTLVSSMQALGDYESIARLLLVDDDPFGLPMSDYKIQDLENEKSKTLEEIYNDGLIYRQGSDYQRISPVRFNPDASDNESCFIRLYYAQTDVNPMNRNFEIGDIYIDIFCAKDKWLTNDSVHKLPIIRPYAIYERIKTVLIDNPTIPIEQLDGTIQLSVNERYDCLRVFVRPWSINNGR